MWAGGSRAQACTNLIINGYNHPTTLRQTSSLNKYLFFPQISDSAGGSCRLLIWFNPGDDPTGMLARSHKLAGTAEGVSIEGQSQTEWGEGSPRG